MMTAAIAWLWFWGSVEVWFGTPQNDSLMYPRSTRAFVVVFWPILIPAAVISRVLFP